MQKRKIVKSGNTSFTMALPIQWVRKNKLDKQSEVCVSENEIGDLLISIEKKAVNPKNETITIQVDGKDNETVGLEFLSAYIRDYSTIVFGGNEIRGKTNYILSQVREHIGVDVIEQTVKNITVKNFFSVNNETAPTFLIRKLGMVNRSLFELLEVFFVHGFTKEDMTEVQRLKDQNEKLYNMVRKSVLKLYENPFLMKNVHTSPLQLSKNKVVALSLKNIASSLNAMGNIFLFLENTKKNVSQVKSVFDALKQNHDGVWRTIAHRNYSKAYDELKVLKSEIASWQRLSKSVQNPLVAECVNYAINCNNLFEDIVYQYIE